MVQVWNTLRIIFFNPCSCLFVCLFRDFNVPGSAIVNVVAQFQVSNFYVCNIWSFLKSLFWMEQIQGSVRVKIKEYVHAWSEFLFHSLLVIFNIFLQIKLAIFTILRLYMACKMWKITALTWEISSCRLVKFHISAFAMYYSLYNWIGEHEITKLKKIFASNPERAVPNG